MTYDPNDGRPVPAYPRSEAQAVVSISGRKDSLATALQAIEGLGRDNVRLVHADTGNEHEITQEYVRDYLPQALGLPIEIVRADFTEHLARKRAYVDTKWRAKGVPDAICDRAMAALVPTGIPFLDMCLWKGRFPSSQSQFCTGELKRLPLQAYLQNAMRQTNLHVESWQGIRRAESSNRANALVWEFGDFGGWIHRPVAHWSVEQVFEIARRHGIKNNPLYTQGMGRVGCGPCINCTKPELRQTSARFPQVIETKAEWESLLSAASKRGFASYFSLFGGDGEPEQDFERNRIERAVEWSRTAHGGKQTELEAFLPPPACSSEYGLCE